MKISTKQRNWLLKKINPLLLFSASTYIMALLSLIPSDQVHGLIGNIIEFYNVHNVMFICAFLATTYSLVQNTQYVSDLIGKLDWLRIIMRCSMEVVIMLFGTLASLLAFLTLFSTKSDVTIVVIIFAVTCFALNVFRSKVVNFYDNALTKIVNDRQKNRRSET